MREGSQDLALLVRSSFPCIVYEIPQESSSNLGKASASVTSGNRIGWRSK
jgi:hypothetical protein